PRTVGRSNRTRTATSTPNTFLTRDITCVASSECPPNSKKLSSTPTLSAPSNCSHTPHNISSSAFRGPTYPSPPLLLSGCGNPFRSSFPFLVNGISSNSTYATGTMYSGSLPCRYSRTSPLSTPFFSPVVPRLATHRS